MCGLSGILARDRSFAIPAEWIERMMSVQSHRGPDDAHAVRFPGCLLGFNRLSIQDTSTRGRQPMMVSGSRAAIVFNGEIYNFIELAGDAHLRGVPLHSRSDTEVLLQSYLRRGEASLRDLNGMFAFAVYDPDCEELFAVRDRFGVKPLYYYQDEAFFCFASEIKALLELPFVPRDSNLPVLFGAVFGRGNDRWEETCFRGVRQLPPSHRMRLSRRLWTPELRRYWRIEPPQPRQIGTTPLQEAGLEEEFRSLLRSAVSLRLRSDRPVGLLLSGGLDSSSIAATLADLVNDAVGSSRNEPPQFFTMSLPGELVNESLVAEETSRWLGMPCRQIQCDALDFERLVPATIWHNEEPLPYLNRCVHWHMMEEIARSGIIVALNGQGGDECLGGYVGRLLGATLAMAYREEGLRGLRQEWRAQRLLRGYSVRWMLSQAAKPFLPHHWVRSFMAVAKERALSLATLQFVERGLLNDYSPRLVRGDYVNDQLLRWLTRDSVPDLCHYEDRNSAAHGLEERFPFLDHRIAEFMFRLPWTLKTYRGVSKVLLRNAMRGRLPGAVLNSHRKIGLEVPEDKWIRQPLAEMVGDVTAGRPFRERGLWRALRVRRLIDRHLSGRSNHGNLIWRIVGTELWFQMFVDRRGPIAKARSQPLTAISVS